MTDAPKKKRSGLPIGTVLQCEDGDAVVVEPGTTPLEGLLILLEESYGGDRFAINNPAVVEALADVKVNAWYSCTKVWKEANSWDESCQTWWAQDGDGKRSITVAWYDGNVYDLGEQAEEAEPTPDKESAL